MKIRLEGVYQYPACVGVFSLCFIAIKHSHSNCNWQFICVFSVLLLADCNQLIIGGDSVGTETILSHCFNWWQRMATESIGRVGQRNAKKGNWQHRLRKFYGLYCMSMEVHNVCIIITQAFLHLGQYDSTVYMYKLRHALKAKQILCYMDHYQKSWLILHVN